MAPWWSPPRAETAWGGVSGGGYRVPTQWPSASVQVPHLLNRGEALSKDALGSQSSNKSWHTLERATSPWVARAWVSYLRKSGVALDCDGESTLLTTCARRYTCYTWQCGTIPALERTRSQGGTPATCCRVALYLRQRRRIYREAHVLNVVVYVAQYLHPSGNIFMLAHVLHVTVWHYIFAKEDAFAGWHT